MKNFFMGVKPGVGPVLKVMKDAADDPLTTPNTNYGKFLFNSEVQKLGYIRRIIRFEMDTVSFPPSGGFSNPATYLYPPGSNISNCEMIVYSYTNDLGTLQYFFLCQEFFGLDYFPLTEVRPVFGGATNTFRGPEVDARLGDVTGRGFSRSNGPIGFANSWFCYGINYVHYYDGVHRVKPAISTVVGTHSNAPDACLVTVFDLPDGNIPVPDNSGIASPGQEVIRIDSTAGGLCRIALPGKTVTDADPSNYILHEERIPAKVLKAGEIDVDESATVAISVPLPLTPYTYMDYHVKRQSGTEWWNPPYYEGTGDGQSLSFTYRVDTDENKVVITNTSSVDLTIRYAICADSEEPPTSGGSKILHIGNDGTQDFVQIKRPGSSDTAPSLNDIMLDTRLSYLPILAEGFLSYPDDFPTAVPFAERHKGERMATVNFNNPDGLLPLVKVGAVFEGAGTHQGNYILNYDPVTVWCCHEVRHTSDPTWNGRASGASVWANIKEESVDFYSGGLNPRWLVGNNISSYPSTMLGLRYYIFGIPQSL